MPGLVTSRVYGALPVGSSAPDSSSRCEMALLTSAAASSVTPPSRVDHHPDDAPAAGGSDREFLQVVPGLRGHLGDDLAQPTLVAGSHRCLLLCSHTDQAARGVQLFMLSHSPPTVLATSGAAYR